MKRISKVQLKKALVKTYGFTKSMIDIRRNPRRPPQWIVTARFKDGSTPLELRGGSLLGAARKNPRLATEFS